MSEKIVEMPIMFADPFAPYDPRGLVSIWVNNFRKLNNEHVICDWSAKAFKNYLPLGEWRMTIWLLHNKGPINGARSTPWTIQVSSPAPSLMPMYQAKQLGLAPIRRLRGVLHSKKIIPGWALDAQPEKVEQAFTRGFHTYKTNYFTIPDASDGNLKRIFDTIQGVIARKFCRKIDGQPIVVLNPKLTFKEKVILSWEKKITVQDTVYHVVPVIHKKAS